jgi:hypothetical protein
VYALKDGLEIKPGSLGRVRSHRIEGDADGRVLVPEPGGEMNLRDLRDARGLARLSEVDDLSVQPSPSF